MTGVPGREDGVWFVYDGDCPICTMAAGALQIRQRFGTLHTLDARTAGDDPLLREIRSRRFDLDQSMVIYHQGRFYHGPTALRFMARHGAFRGGFNLFNKMLFWSDTLAMILYPWMRGLRNRLLRYRGIGRLDNLDRASRPIFMDVFGADWDSLPVIFHKHYANRPYGDDIVTVEGVLEVHCAGPIRLLSPLLALTGGIPPFTARGVPATVRFKSDHESSAFHFNRLFRFPGRKPYVFHSRLIPCGGNEMIEVMPFGLGWRASYAWENGKVVLRHRGYVLHLLGHDIPLPLTPILGRGHAEETAIDDETFDMHMEIIHPWWGSIYGYRGRFTVTSMDLA
jgi:predicted DCC family thiol-disulfide oxidoreductase YuxK